eukprot:m.114079 g.114079  ORF g.114079 m.114079 type:complete len:232 (-) comp9149_c1_seq1:199-894(-)
MRKSLPSYPYATDFCDHFETPACAYEHIVPVLDALCARLGRTRATLQIYDPYYCKGAMTGHLAALGFTAVWNVCEDFYAVAARGETPSYDVLVTNPPYSEDHKAKCLAFCMGSGRPWLLLMPCYVASKQYYAAVQSGAWFLLPTERYQYTHPTGRGHEQSPFESMWFIGSGAAGESDALLATVRAKRHPDRPQPTRIETALQSLHEAGIVAARRMNPKRRRRELKKKGLLE